MNTYLKPPTMLLRLSSCSPKNNPETAVPMIDSAIDPPTRTRMLAHNGRSLSHKIAAIVVGPAHPSSASPKRAPTEAMIRETARRGLPRRQIRPEPRERAALNLGASGTTVRVADGSLFPVDRGGQCWQP